MYFKHNPPSKHIMVVFLIVDGRGHGLLDFHAYTKESLTYKCQSPKVLNTSFRRRGGQLGGGD